MEVIPTDDVCITDVTRKMLQFNPLCREVADSLCQQLHIESQMVRMSGGEVGLLGPQCKTETIVGDGIYKIALATSMKLWFV